MTMNQPLEALNERELEIIPLLAEGLSNKEIADRLFLAPSTVKWYVRQLNSKLDTSTREEIVEQANALGLLEPSATSQETYSSMRDNLPRQTTPFVGRDAELDEIHAIIEKADVQLLTILAPGGMGKTRISLEAAEQQINHFPDGVYFVPLQPLSDGDHIIPQIAQSVGYQLTKEQREPKQQVLDFLANKQLLLLMDNFEHLLDHAPLVNEILQTAPHVKIIVTSREKLNLLGETIYSLQGMQFPSWETPEDALRYDAVQLLVQAAQRVKHDWQVTSDNLDYVTRVCRLTQGMPLGILLAASWLDIYGLERICDEIQKSADILETELRDIPERQRSIRAVFDYSWSRLKPQEQDIFMKMSLFRGGCTPEAAESITGANPRQLQNLLSKALISRNREGRYDIHELLRQYAEKLLKSDENQYTQTLEKHCHFYLKMLASKTPLLKGGGKQTQAAKDIAIDYENIILTWDYAIEQRWFDLLGGCVDAMKIYVDNWKKPDEWYVITDHVLEINDTHDTCLYIKVLNAKSKSVDEILPLLDLPQVQQNSTLRRACLDSIAWLLFAPEGDHETALDYAQKALLAAIEEGDPYYIGRVYYSLCFAKGANGDIEGWFEALQKCHHIFETHQDLLGMRFSLSALEVYASRIEGNYHKSTEYAEQFNAICIQLDAQKWRAVSLISLVGCRLFTGQLEAAHATFNEAQQIFKRLNIDHNPRNIKAYFAIIEGHYDEAYQLATELMESENNISALIHPMLVLSIVAAARNTDDLVDSIRVIIYQSSLENPEQYAFTSWVLPAMARFYMQQEEFVYATEICSIALHHPRCPGKLFDLLPIMPVLINELKGLLSTEAFETAWERGKTMEFSPVIRRFMDEVGNTDE